MDGKAAATKSEELDARKGKDTEGNTWATRAGRPVEELVSNRGRRIPRGRNGSGDGKRERDRSRVGK